MELNQQRLGAVEHKTQPTIPTPTSSSASNANNRRKKRLYITLIVLLVVVLVAGSLAAFFLFSANTAQTQKTIVGHAFFISSGQVSQHSDFGIADEIRVTLQNLPSPQAGKRYYLWLLGESQSDVASLLLGTLPLNQSRIDIFYPNPEHNDLLAHYGRLLVTEEDASSPPANPSFDTGTWRYYAEFSNAPNPLDTQNHFSLLAHLRHLLAQDPKLSKMQLGGGLDIWLLRNVEKVLEWAGSARDAQQTCQAHPEGGCQFAQRQATRILDYLDGPYSWQEQVPLDIQGSHLLVDSTVARVALLEFDEIHQEPPGYLKHIGTHLREITESPGVTSRQRTLAIQIDQAINNVQGWLDKVRSDSQQIVHMSAGQLVRPDTASLFDDLYTQANSALVGQTDLSTNKVQEGVIQIHDNIQQMATFDITPCVLNSAKSACVVS